VFYIITYEGRVTHSRPSFFALARRKTSFVRPVLDAFFSAFASRQRFRWRPSHPMETLIMAEHVDDESPRTFRKRAEPFLDCVAHLLAKRWLRDQRQQEQKSSEKKPESHAEQLGQQR
jgi:hypothetical protein